jgi:tetratricopeptide (TPR) repeat protein
MASGFAGAFMPALRITVSPPGGDRVHHVTPDDIRVVLSRLPADVCGRLKAVHLNDRCSGVRRLGYVNRARRELALCACPPRLSLARFLVRGQSPGRFGARRGRQWPGLAVRRFLLYDVLLHELGHLQPVDVRARSSRRRFAGETLAQAFAMRWCATLWAEPFDHPDPVHNRPTPAEFADDDGDLTDLVRLAALRPEDAELARRLGRAFRTRGRVAEAQSEYERAVALDPTDPWTLLRLGNCHFAQQDWVAAAARFQQACDLMPNNATPYWCLAEAAKRGGDLPTADVYYRRAAEVDPANRTARRKLRDWQHCRDSGEQSKPPPSLAVTGRA